jgi:hypothetical protein
MRREGGASAAIEGCGAGGEADLGPSRTHSAGDACGAGTAGTLLGPLAQLVRNVASTVPMAERMGPPYFVPGEGRTVPDASAALPPLGARIRVCYNARMRVLSTTPEVVGALERFGASLRSTFGSRLQEVTLFGSRARGDAREDSDVDVLVVIDELSERERGEVFDLAWSASIRGDEYVVLAPIPYSTAQACELRRREKRLMREIAHHGVPLRGWP